MQDDAVPGATGELAYEIPTVHFACMYQPLDEIRDYFGDDNAIYFSWLATYTRALGFAGIWGTITMVEQWVGVLREPGDPGGVDDKSNMKVVDADHGTIVYYHGRHWISGKVDPNKVLVCWCDK